MMGAPGPSGPAGSTGNRGESGPGGPGGPAGPAGPRGPAGPAGGKGGKGEAGGAGAGGEKGFRGDPGPQGMHGGMGRPGENGGAGAAGPTGPRGIPGSQGPAGRDGHAGNAGVAGGTGPRGPSGGSGPAGPAGPPGPPGPPGPSGGGGGYFYESVQAEVEKGPDPLRFYRGDEAVQEKAVQAQEMEASLKTISGKVDLLQVPDGSRERPARTCRDLHLNNPDLKSGNYWVDPNKGSPIDAMEVWCNMEKGHTCVAANPKSVARKGWHSAQGKEQKHIWFGENVQGGFKFTYGDDSLPANTAAVQITFLRLLSREASQKLTYHCRNSVAVSDERGDFGKALLLQGSSEVEIRAQGNSRFTYSVLEDGCKSHTGQWGRAEIEYKSQKTSRLPILDIAPMDIGGPEQEFGIDIGPVCFF